MERDATENLKALVARSARKFFDDVAAEVASAVATFHEAVGSDALKVERDGWNQTSVMRPFGDFQIVRLDITDEERPDLVVDTRLHGRESRRIYAIVASGSKLAVQVDSDSVGPEEFVRRAFEPFLNAIELE